jgi:hypothetical protein
MLKMLNASTSLMLSVIAYALVGCGSGDYNSSSNPNFDGNWTERSVGIDETLHQIPSGTSLPENETAPDPICTTLDVDGDGTMDSKKTVLEFTSNPNVGKYSIYVYLSDAQCVSLQSDFIDQMQFNYTIYSGDFRFNRIDGEVIAVGRIVNTQSAADLMSDDDSCGTLDWIVSTDLVGTSGCSATEMNSLSAFQLNENTESPKVIGEKVEGLYVHMGSYFTYKIGKEGHRPNASEIADYTGSYLTGDPLFVEVN